MIRQLSSIFKTMIFIAVNLSLRVKIAILIAVTLIVLIVISAILKKKKKHRIEAEKLKKMEALNNAISNDRRVN